MKQRLLSAFVILCVLAGGAWSVQRFLKGAPHPEAFVKTPEPENDGEQAMVTLSPGKLAIADIESTPVQLRSMQTRVIVPGRLQYDDTRHIDIKSATAGILVEIRVKPGDPVEAGAVLAVISSPEIGQARADVLKSEAECDLAEQRLQWAEDIRQGMSEIVSGIKERKTSDEIRTATEGMNLGDYRERLMTAYSRYQLATKLKSKLEGVDQGAIAARTVLERTSEEEAAHAALSGAIEQARYDSRLQSNEARLASNDAQRRAELAKQHLRALLGPNHVEAMPESDESGDDLARVEIRAPFAGSIERRMFSESERVIVGDALFVLADSSRLWVAADVREQEWGVLALNPQSTLRVTVPALEGAEFQATLYYVGREVSALGNSLPLLARIENEGGQLRPGLFVRVELPLGESRETLAVPDSAIQVHEGRRFVFVTESAGCFRSTDVEIGESCDGWTEIRNGLNVGDQVVSKGAFILKSERLLEGESEA
jgi:cobalt-zinc-cadmium efflux system membrane fusion protein